MLDGLIDTIAPKKIRLAKEKTMAELRRRLGVQGYVTGFLFQSNHHNSAISAEVALCFVRLE